MGLFDPISTAVTGVDASETWLNALSDNIANMNDVTSTSQGAYQERYVEMQAVPGQAGGTGSGSGSDGSIGSGVAVTGIALGSPQGVEQYDPTNPLADKNGEVRVPDVDTATQLTGLIQAQDDYQANANALQHATTAYQAALALGK